MALSLSHQPFLLLQEAPGHQLAIGQPIEPDWCALADLPLLVLVGLTGAGKTTLFSHLSQKPGRISLPDRRKLTDQIILPAAVLPAAAVTQSANLSRQERFAATARFKNQHPGGMGEVLAALHLKLAETERPPLLLFDGLRGRAEVEWAAQALPRARFLLLALDDETRVARLAGRGDAFDGLNAMSGTRRLKDAQAIVESESLSYSYDESKSALQQMAPDRHLELNSGQLSAELLQEAAENFLKTTAF